MADGIVEKNFTTNSVQVQQNKIYTNIAGLVYQSVSSPLINRSDRLYFL